MTRSRPSSRNSTRAVLLSSLLGIFLLAGCEVGITPTYKEEDIPYLVKNICKDEYGLDVTTYRTDTTLWIYAPLAGILHKEYGKNPEKTFKDEVFEKFRNILSSVGRVLISADRAPDFYVLVLSDTLMGFDYALTGSTLDVKKNYAGAIPWTEANRRYIDDFQLNAKAINDRTGAHLIVYSITMPEFLSRQIAQRLTRLTGEPAIQGRIKTIKAQGKYDLGVFSFDYLTEKGEPPLEEAVLEKAMADTIAYTLRTYDFEEYSGVLLTDAGTQRTLELTKEELKVRVLP